MSPLTANGALTTLARALDAVRNECKAVVAWSFRSDLSLAHRGCGAWRSGCARRSLWHEPGRSEDGPSPLKQRFRECVKAEIAATLDDLGMVDAEMQALFAALAG